jgi:TRAP-type transport system periplasmic protein
MSVSSRNELGHARQLARGSTTVRISRRQALTGVAGVAIAGLAGSRRAAAAAEFTFKLGHDQPATHPQNLRAVEAANKITQESGGRLVVQVYPNNQLGGDTQMLAQVRSGALELLMVGDNILANIVPVTSVSDLPFAFAGYKDLWAAMDGKLGDYIRGEIRKVGLHVFDKGWDAGFRQVFTSNRPVHNVADMKGLKLRVPQAPIQIAVFKAFGASPTAVNNSELYTSMQTHLVDGAEQPLISIESARLFEVSKYISMTNHQPTSFEMVGNEAAWRRLPADLQGILARNLDAGALLERADIANGEEDLAKQLKTQGQTIIIPDRESFRAVIQKAGLYAKWRDTYGAQPFSLLEETVGKLT